MKDRPAAVVALVAVVALLALTSCGSSTSTLDQAGTERAVQRAIGSRITWDVDRITCPADIPTGTGETVVCRAVLADGAGSVRLRVRQVEDGKTVRVALLDAVVDRQEAARRLHKALVTKFKRSFRASCGTGPPVVLAPGRTLQCYARDDGGPRPVTATVVDPAGTLRFDLA